MAVQLLLRSMKGKTPQIGLASYPNWINNYNMTAATPYTVRYREDFNKIFKTVILVFLIQN